MASHHIFYINSGFSDFLTKYRNIPIHHFGKKTSIKCGLYVILFIHYISHFGLRKYTSFLYSRFV